MVTGRALGRAGVTLSVASVVMMAAVSLAGPSVINVHAPGPGPQRSLGHPFSEGGTTAILFVAMSLGGVALLLSWLALRRGWTPAPRRLIATGVGSAILLALAPPMASTDIAIYAAYGRMVRLGLNPYTDNVADLVARGDPIGRAYAGVWTDVSSVYGPVAMAWNWLAAVIGGDSARWITWILQLTAAVFFVAIALILDRRAAPLGAAARARVALLWTLNPLLLLELVNAAHVDVLAVLLGIGALLSLRRSVLVSGLLMALALGVKVTFGLYAVAIAWALRRERRALLWWLAAVIVTAAAVFLPVFPEILGPLREGSRRVTSVSVWHSVQIQLTGVVGLELSRTLVGIGSWLLLALVVWRIAPALPGRSEERSVSALHTAALLALAWLLTATYALPWYDGVAWAPLVLLPASGLDLVLLARFALTALATLPGGAHAAGATDSVMQLFRGTVAPTVAWLLVVVVLLAGRRLRLPPPAGTPAPSPPR